MSELVSSETRGQVGVVVLNRPQALNALSQQLRSELQHELVRFDEDPEIRVMVLTGAGGNFSAGRDLKEAGAGVPMYASRDEQLAAFGRTSTKKPVIAAVEGWVLAGGFELALSCDLVVASDEAVFALPEVQRNLVAVGGGLLRLPRRIPYHLAMRMALTGERMSAEAMRDAGVVGEVTPPGEALDRAIELADRIAGYGHEAVCATKAIIRRAVDPLSERDAFDVQDALAKPAFDSPDREAGISAFVNRDRD